jgi:hypothetical protein
MPVSSHPLSQEQLMAYLDGELSISEATNTAAHLQHCRECQEAAADLQRISRCLSTWQVAPPSSTLTENWEKALRESVPQKLLRTNPAAWFKWRNWSFGFIAAAAVLFAIVPAFLFRHPSESHLAPQIASEEFMRLEQSAKLQKAPAANNRLSSGSAGRTLLRMPESSPVPPPAQASATAGPLIIRTARLNLTTNDFAHVRESISRVLASYTGYVAQLEMNTPTGEARSLDATLRIPAAQLDATLLELKRLGHVDSESQRGEEVTQRVTDVQARLSNLRTAEARLTDILRQRTGKLADVLAVEEQIDSVRGQIETTEAEQKSLAKQIAFATVQLRVSEEYKKSLTSGHISTGTRLHNAIVEGFQTLADAVIGLLLFFLSYGPVLLFIAALLFFPTRAVWKCRRP